MIKLKYKIFLPRSNQTARNDKQNSFIYIRKHKTHVLCSHISENEKCLFNMLYRISADRLILKRITLHFFLLIDICILK